MKKPAAFLIVLLFTGLALSAALSQTVSVPGSTSELKTKYDEKVKLDVLRPHELAVADLNTKFAAALERSQEAAQKSGKLEEAIAIKMEKEAVQAGNYTPAADDAKTAAGLKTLRATYRTALAKLELDRDKKLRPLKDVLAKSLEAVIDTLTKNGKLEEAMAAKKMREELLAPASSVSDSEKPVSVAPGGKMFVNSLGMKFLPVQGTNILICIHETRKGDYAAYSAENVGVYDGWKAASRDGVPVSTGEDHPVTNVNWDDAKAFCAWLSKKEKLSYRLPTDKEWSYAVGIGNKERWSREMTPEMMSQKLQKVYPWGGHYPPQSSDLAGNYGDLAWNSKFPTQPFIVGYNDGIVTTAPVMSFRPNQQGIYDLGGNVWEWCEDKYSAAGDERVLRGGSWFSYESNALLSSNREHIAPDSRFYNRGFRCVLESAP